MFDGSRTYSPASESSCVDAHELVRHATVTPTGSWCNPLDGRVLHATMDLFPFPPDCEALRLGQRWADIRAAAGRSNVDYALSIARRWGEKVPCLGSELLPSYERRERLERAFENMELGLKHLSGAPIVTPFFRLDPHLPLQTSRYRKQFG